MRKFWIILCLSACILHMLGGCAAPYPPAEEPAPAANTPAPTEASAAPTAMPEETPYLQEEFIWELGKHGKYYVELIRWDEFESVWLVFNAKNEVVHHATDTRTTVAEMGREDLLCIFFRTSYDYCFYTFYNPVEDRFSEQYGDILWTDYGLVAYMEEENPPSYIIKLVVRDIFDEEVFYAEFFRDFTYADNPRYTVKDFRFIDENSVYIEYFIGVYEGYVSPDPDSETRSEIIYFRDPETGMPLSEGKGS